jgi:hypothetical protein
MKIYHYDAVTGEHIGDGFAKQSPLDAKLGNKVYMIPAHATEIEPPEVVEGKVITFTNGAWEYFDIPTPQNIPELTEAQILQMQINEIQRELEILDSAVPRILEDIIEQGNFAIHQSKLDVIARKIELRLQLQILGG